jgi:uncharacterized glyoxalase superfamily protein PhnB
MAKQSKRRTKQKPKVNQRRRPRAKIVRPRRRAPKPLRVRMHAAPPGASPIPPGHTTVTPHLVVHDGSGAIDFYVRAFEAEPISQVRSPDGRLLHATLRIGNGVLHLNDDLGGEEGAARAPARLNGTASSINLYVHDADAAFARAVAAGATVLVPLMDQFWGDRFGMLKDPFGHLWGIATRRRDLSDAEIEKAAAEFFSRMAARGP